MSLSIVLWSALGLATRHGPSVLLALFIVLTLVGGGIGHVPFFLALWAYATRIRSSLSWWRRRLSPAMRSLWSRAWLPSLTLSSILFLVALELSVFGYPPMRNDPEGLLLAIWSLLLVSWVLLNVACVSAIARDSATRRGTRAPGGTRVSPEGVA